MKIQIDGTNTLNKGAELMLYAILEQIEKKAPKAQVYYNSNNIGEKGEKLQSNLSIKKRLGLKYSRIPAAILRRLKIPYTYFTSKYPMKGIDLVLDGAGFQFSDQWDYSKEMLDTLEKYYRTLKARGTKIVFLPQAYGPFKTLEGKRSVEIINKYVDIIIAREEVSYNYLIEAGANKEKVLLYSDFTLLVKGDLLDCYTKIKDQVCVIPNRKMITHTGSNVKHYLNFMESIVLHAKSKGKQVFLLNHEGKGDMEICLKINERLKDKLNIISGLNAKEVKGVISASYLVLSSRFHGVASALNQGVPCLATSWNHKYEMLFKDFGLSEKYIVDVLGDFNESKNKLDNLLDHPENAKISKELKERKIIIENNTNEMWNLIWQTHTLKNGKNL